MWKFDEDSLRKMCFLASQMQKGFTIGPVVNFGSNTSLEGLLEQCAQFQRKNRHWHDMALSEHAVYPQTSFNVFLSGGGSHDSRSHANSVF